MAVPEPALPLATVTAAKPISAINTTIGLAAFSKNLRIQPKASWFEQKKEMVAQKTSVETSPLAT